MLSNSDAVHASLADACRFSQSEEDVQIGMHKVIEAIKNHRDAWPFINPVDEDYAPNYYKIIDHPMDLQTMEDKLDNQEYSSLDEFKADFDRIVENCRTYNGPVSGKHRQIIICFIKRLSSFKNLNWEGLNF